MTADEIIACLGTLPHPEGGHFVEDFRAPTIRAASDGSPGGDAVKKETTPGVRRRRLNLPP